MDQQYSRNVAGPGEIPPPRSTPVIFDYHSASISESHAFYGNPAQYATNEWSNDIQKTPAAEESADEIYPYQHHRPVKTNSPNTAYESFKQSYISDTDETPHPATDIKSKTLDLENQVEILEKELNAFKEANIIEYTEPPPPQFPSETLAYGPDICPRCNQVGHIRRECPQEICNQCYRPCASRNHCRRYIPRDPNRQLPPDQIAAMAKHHCPRCNQIGHYRSVCPQHVCNRCGVSCNTAAECISREFENKRLNTQLHPPATQKPLPTCNRCGQTSHTTKACQVICSTCGSICRSMRKCQNICNNRIPGQNCIRCNNPNHQARDCYNQTCPRCFQNCPSEVHCEAFRNPQNQFSNYQNLTFTPQSAKPHVDIASLDGFRQPTQSFVASPSQPKYAKLSTLNKSERNKLFCQRCKKHGHPIAVCRKICTTCGEKCNLPPEVPHGGKNQKAIKVNAPNPPGTKFVHVCKRCNLQGHRVKKCEKPCPTCGEKCKFPPDVPHKKPNRQDPPNPPGSKLNLFCKRCKLQGHVMRNCEKPCPTCGVHCSSPPEVPHTAEDNKCHRCKKNGHVRVACPTICKKCGTMCVSYSICKLIEDNSKPGKPCARCSHKGHQRIDCSQTCTECNGLCYNDEHCKNPEKVPKERPTVKRHAEMKHSVKNKKFKKKADR